MGYRRRMWALDEISAKTKKPTGNILIFFEWGDVEIRLKQNKIREDKGFTTHQNPRLFYKEDLENYVVNARFSKEKHGTKYWYLKKKGAEGLETVTFVPTTTTGTTATLGGNGTTFYYTGGWR